MNPTSLRTNVMLIACAAGLFLTGCTSARKSVGVDTWPFDAVTAVEHQDTAKRSVVVENAEVIMDAIAPGGQMVSRDLTIGIEDSPNNNWLVTRPGSRAYKVTTAKVVLPADADVEFRGKITNNGENAIRFEKAALTVTVDGKLQNLDQAKYKAFNGVVVPGKSTISVDLPGPHIHDLTDGAVVRLTINDFTANRKLVNAAWTFTAKMEQRTASVEKFEEVKELYPNEVSQLKSQIRRDMVKFQNQMKALSSTKMKTQIQ